MNRCYSDILARIATPPLWFDEHAVPRFEPFTPDMLDIYADEAALVGIECQACGKRFKVAFCTSLGQRVVRNAVAGGKFDFEAVKADTLEARVRDLDYGDPPNIGCCPSGPTMSSNPKCVLEFWKRDRGPHACDWRRVPELEVDLESPWDDETDVSPLADSSPAVEIHDHDGDPS